MKSEINMYVTCYETVHFLKKIEIRIFSKGNFLWIGEDGTVPNMEKGMH